MVGYLSTLADELLAAAVAALVEATTGHAPPSEAYVAHSLPAADNCCDGGQLTVHLATLTHSIDQFPQRCQVVPSPTFHITLMRCQAGLRDGPDPLPDPADIEDDAHDLLIDLWAVLTEIYDRLEENTLFPGQASCDDVILGDVLPLETEGACAGWVIPVTVQANDAGPVGS